VHGPLNPRPQVHSTPTIGHFGLASLLAIILKIPQVLPMIECLHSLLNLQCIPLCHCIEVWKPTQPPCIRGAQKFPICKLLITTLPIKIPIWLGTLAFKPLLGIATTSHAPCKIKGL
jgi:hypothetical protein